MKPRSLNCLIVSLFGKLMAALALGIVITAVSAQAQQGQFAADGCLYTPVFSAPALGAQQGSVQMVRQGCAVQSTDGQARYYDVRTGQLYLMENNASQPGSKAGKIFKALVASHKQVLQAFQGARAQQDPAVAPPAQSGINPSFELPYPVAGVSSPGVMDPGICGNGANCMQLGGPNIPAIGLAAPVNDPVVPPKATVRQAQAGVAKPRAAR